MEYRVVAGELGAFYVEGLDPKDSASMIPFNTKYSEQIPVMQYTGLKYKNGMKIYEGDIFQDEEDMSCNFVEWDSTYGGWTTNEWFTPMELATEAENMEVIGNIYETPEVLKV